MLFNRGKDMASFAIPTTVTAGDGARTTPVKVGVAVAQGLVVYRATATRDYRLARANSAVTAVVAGIMTAGGSANAKNVPMLTEGVLEGLSGLIVGETYVLSDSVAGNIMPISDLTTGDYVCILGVAISATQLLVKIINSGVTHA